MMFCPKCGSLLKPKKESGKSILACSCGFRQKDVKSAILTVESASKAEPSLQVADESDDLKSMPQAEAECPKCGHGKARFWTVQTRAADEPETKFLKCEKCKHTWRDYS